MTIPWRALILIWLTAWWGAASQSAEGAEKIFTAVLLASNSPTPKELPGQLGAACTRLKRVIGYNQFEILGSTTTEIDEAVENWAVPTENFWLSIKARRTNERVGTFLLDVQLFHDQRPLVGTAAKLGPQSPLFIRGPVHASGQILIVLLVQP